MGRGRISVWLEDGGGSSSSKKDLDPLGVCVDTVRAFFSALGDL